MKNFFYTITGKTLVLVLSALVCVVGIAAFAGGVACASLELYSKNEYTLYEKVEEQWVNRMANVILSNVTLDQKHPVTIEKNYNAQLGVYGYDDKNGEYSILVAKTTDYEGKSSEDAVYDSYLHSDGKHYQVRGLDKSGTMDSSLRWMKLAFRLRYLCWVIFVVSIILEIIGFVILMTVSGRKSPEGEATAGFGKKLPVDVLLVLFAGYVAIIFSQIGERITFCGNTGEMVAWFALSCIGGFVMVLCGMLLCMNVALHCKLHNLVKTTMVYRCFCLGKKILSCIWQWVVKMFCSIPLIPKTVGVFFGICLLELAAISMFSYDIGKIVMLWMLEKCLLLPLFMYLALMLRRLHIGAKNMAEGGLTESLDTRYMKGILKEHADYLGSIAKGMRIAVGEQVKSERMKTELITNVSHDLKTPLTSIVNYADLIEKESTDNKTIKEYSGVLLKQSQKLKRLIEDLVEVSKATTGNLEVQLVPCDAGVFLEQADGEYQEKLAGANLELIIEKPTQEIMVMADGRRMWRVFDNLMNNIVKYAKEGTRVYLSLTKEGENAVICFKNMSNAMLNISAEELMERFVRGEQSRTTEGNGLGLSIAQNLTELQNGKFSITIDGDLFKATMKFPCI
ncbi:Signal transduction histidine kinase [Lachnospiraceae bacterium XBB1006]|nr:Signal transduction histidine kinase [Lachnospiraceae bacterium XBB1006]